MSKLVNQFVNRHVKVRRSDCNPNPLISTTYSFEEELECYSVIGEHSMACRSWVDSNPVTPSSAWTRDEYKVAEWYAMATINPQFPLDIPHQKLIEDYCQSRGIKAVIEKREHFYQVSYDLAGGICTVRAVKCFKLREDAEAFALTQGAFEYRLDFMTTEVL